MKKVENTTQKWLYFFSIATLIYTGLKLTNNIGNQFDITFGDEAEYMNNGLLLFKTIHKDWGPTYNIWYKFLSFFTTNKIDLYHLNFAVGMVVLPIVVFVFLVTFGVNNFIALVLSFCLQVSNLNVCNWPRISHFVLIVFLVVAIITKHLQLQTNKLIVFAIAIIICAYSRTEFYLSFYIIILLIGYYLYKEKKYFKQSIPFIFLLAFTTGFLYLVYGFPADFFRGFDRKYIAFCQHYSLNYTIQTKQKIFHPILEWITFSKQQFVGCNTFMDILKKYPESVFNNAIFNIKNYFLTVILLLQQILLPVILFKKKKLVLLLFTTILLLLFYLIVKNKSALFNKIKQNKLYVLAITAFIFPTIISAILIFPRQHYIIFQVPFLMLFIGIIFSNIKTLKAPIFSYFLIVVCIIISPTIKKYTLVADKENLNFSNTKVIKYLTDKKDFTKQTIFDDQLNLNLFLTENYKEYNIEYNMDKFLSIKNCIEKDAVSIILVSPSIQKLNKIKADSTWTQLLANPNKFGFTKEIYDKNCETYLLIKTLQ